MSAKSISPTAAHPPGSQPDPDELRARLHQMWSGVAGAWGANAAFVDQRGAVVSRQMLELAALSPGARVLELACGAGGIGLEAAALVGPGGEVVQSDVAASMTSIAAERAAARGLENVHSRVLDLEHIDEPDRSFDVVLCREGLMLVPDPVLAAGEIRRVLRPGGQVVLSVWGPRAQNPWLGLLFDVVSGELGEPVPPPGLPHPFSLGDADRVAGVLAGAGLSDVVVSEQPTPYLAASAEEWWQRSSALAGPLAQRLAALPEEAKVTLGTRAAEAIAAYETPTGLEIPGLSLIATGSRPVSEAVD